jgi:hypothetical protein
MRSVSTWISYLHANSWIFARFLTNLINFLNSKTDLDFPKILIQNPFQIWRTSYGKSCSYIQILQNHILFKMFQVREDTFWIGQTLERLWIELNRLNFEADSNSFYHYHARRLWGVAGYCRLPVRTPPLLHTAPLNGTPHTRRPTVLAAAPSSHPFSLPRTPFSSTKEPVCTLCFVPCRWSPAPPAPAMKLTRITWRRQCSPCPRWQLPQHAPSSLSLLQLVTQRRVTLTDLQEHVEGASAHQNIDANSERCRDAAPPPPHRRCAISVISCPHLLARCTARTPLVLLQSTPAHLGHRRAAVPAPPQAWTSMVIVRCTPGRGGTMGSVGCWARPTGRGLGPKPAQYCVAIFPIFCFPLKFQKFV